MKKIILLLLALVPVCVFAFDYSYQGVVFKCKPNGQTVCITAFSVKAKMVVIPATVSFKGKEYRVTSVSTFMNGVNYLAESLVLEEGIEEIDKFSFNEFRKLESVSLPSSIKHIGKNAFRNNDGMQFILASDIDEQVLRSGKECYPIIGGTANSEMSNALVYSETPKESKSKFFKPKSEMSGTSVSKSPQSVVERQSKPGPQKPKETLADIDMNIPSTSEVNSDTYCVIIANEKYEDVPEVEFAERDGQVFKEYCAKTLGIPEKQIKTFINASYTDIKRAMNWIETIAEVTEGKSKFIFYYAGHGLPNEKDKTAYLIPIDGFPKDITTCYKLSELYTRLSKLQTQSVTVFLDACFSGVERGSSQALVAARGVAIKPKDEVLSGNVVVFTATSDDETALSYKEKQHGMFTYYLLSELKKSKGKARFGELFRAVSSQVKKSSVLENDKLQTPSVNCSASMQNKWEDLHF